MQNHIIFTVVWIYIFILLFAGRVLIGSNLYLRKCNSSSSSLLSDTRRSLGASRHCLGQQLFKHRYFLHDSPKNETTHQHVRRFGRKRKHRTYSSSWYHNQEANTGKFLLSSSSNFFFYSLCQCTVSSFGFDLQISFHIQDATHGAQKQLGDDIRAHPDRILSSIEKVNVRLRTERYAFANVSGNQHK
jgi:hypothetical protein